MISEQVSLTYETRKKNKRNLSSLYKTKQYLQLGKNVLSFKREEKKLQTKP